MDLLLLKSNKVVAILLLSIVIYGCSKSTYLIQNYEHDKNIFNQNLLVGFNCYPKLQFSYDVYRSSDLEESHWYSGKKDAGVLVSTQEIFKQANTAYEGMNVNECSNSTVGVILKSAKHYRDVHAETGIGVVYTSLDITADVICNGKNVFSNIVIEGKSQRLELGYLSGRNEIEQGLRLSTSHSVIDAFKNMIRICSAHSDEY